MRVKKIQKIHRLDQDKCLAKITKSNNNYTNKNSNKKYYQNNREQIKNHMNKKGDKQKYQIRMK